MGEAVPRVPPPRVPPPWPPGQGMTLLATPAHTGPATAGIVWETGCTCANTTTCDVANELPRQVIQCVLRPKTFSLSVWCLSTVRRPTHRQMRRRPPQTPRRRRRTPPRCHCQTLPHRHQMPRRRRQTLPCCRRQTRRRRCQMWEARRRAASRTRRRAAPAAWRARAAPQNPPRRPAAVGRPARAAAAPSAGPAQRVRAASGAAHGETHCSTAMHVGSALPPHTDCVLG